MLNITLDLDTGLAKLASATTIKAGADVPVTINTVRGATPSSPGASPAFELGICTDAAPPVLKAYLDEFDAENDHTFTGVLDANDERLVAFMAGKATANCQCEVAWTVAGQLEVAPNFAVPVQSRGIPSDPNSQSGPHYYTETEVDALLAVLAARGAQVALVAATGNLTLSGTQTIDGVAVIAGDVVFAKSQTTAADRKRYAVAAGAWTAIDQPRAVVVQKGTVNAGLIFVLSAANTYAGITAADVNPAGAAIANALAGKLDASTAATLTNKRITPRVGTATSSATPTINTDNVDRYDLTAQAEAITSFTTNLSGTPTNGQALWISVKGTAARAITWGASFESGAATLPTTTVSTDRLDVLFAWNAVTSKWRCVLTTAADGGLPLAGGTMDENAIVNLFNGSKWQQSTPDKGIAGTAGFSIICSAGYEYKFALGYLFILSDGSSTVRKVLYAPVAPTTAEDTTLGYTTDTTWEMADGTQYRCTDVTEGAAVWALVASLPTPPSDGHPYGFKDGAVVRLADSAIYTALFATNVTSIAGWAVTGDTPILDGTDVRFANPGSITALQGCYNFDTGGTVDFSVLTGLLTLGWYAFDGQDLVGTLTLPDSLITIAENVFQDTGFTGPLILPPNLTTIGAYAFKSVPFAYATIPASVTSIGDYVFRYSAFTVLNAYVDASVIEGAGMTLYDSGITTIHARASDGSWTAGSGQTIGGKGSIEVIKDL